MVLAEFRPVGDVGAAGFATTDLLRDSLADITPGVTLRDGWASPGAIDPKSNLFFVLNR